jgi:hypothetical protein
VLIFLNCIAGIIIDKNFQQEVQNFTEKTISYLNNGIKYGRNKWAFHLNILRYSDSNELVRAGNNKI